MTRISAALIFLSSLTPAWADNLTIPAQKHTATCRSLAACPIRKPNGVGGWQVLTKDVQIDEKEKGVWLADLSKAKAFAGGKGQLAILAADGTLLEIEVSIARR